MSGFTPVWVAIIAGSFALFGYLCNSASTKRTEKAKRYADALTAIERYKHLPRTFHRRHDETPEVREELGRALVECQVAVSFHRRWLNLESPRAGAAYENLLGKIRERNRDFRRQALAAEPISRDLEIEVGDTYGFDERTELLHCLEVMRNELSLFRNFF